LELNLWQANYTLVAMMQRRTLRITAWILMFIMGTIVAEGYDVLSGGNILEAFIEPDRGLLWLGQ
jgi:hypothetical protein